MTGWIAAPLGAFGPHFRKDAMETMTQEQIIARHLAKPGFVTWDRCVHDPATGRWAVYGWIKGQPLRWSTDHPLIRGTVYGERDFVLVIFDRAGKPSEMLTSSAKYTKELSELFGLPGHEPCRRVAEVFGEGA